jgi:hypothetical protein
VRRLLLFTALTAGLVAAAALPGCTRDPSRSVRFMIWGAPEEIRVVQGYLDEFEQAHPGIDVVVEHAPSMGYTQKLQTLVRGDNLPDVMYLGEGDLPWMVEQKAVYDLTELVERDRAELDPDEGLRHAGPLLQPRPVRQVGRPLPGGWLDVGRLPGQGQGRLARRRLRLPARDLGGGALPLGVAGRRPRGRRGQQRVAAG